MSVESLSVPLQYAIFIDSEQEVFSPLRAVEEGELFPENVSSYEPLLQDLNPSNVRRIIWHHKNYYIVLLSDILDSGFDSCSQAYF